MSLKSVANLDQLDADALRALAEQLMGELAETHQVVAKQAHDIHFKETHTLDLISVRVVDHIVVGAEYCTSLAQRGLL